MLDRAMVARATPLVLLLVLAAALPLWTSGFMLDMAIKVMVLAIFALSLELQVGQTGLVCFGQAGFFGIGAYAVTLMSPDGQAASLWWTLPAAMAVAGAYAILVGALSLRTQGVYFIMITLAFSQMAYFVAHDTPLGGGSDGVYLYFKPEAVIAGHKVFDLDAGHAFYVLVWVCLVGSLAGSALLLRSRFGHALAGIKANEQRMRAAGFDTFGYKLAIFVVSAMMAGLAGYLTALKDGFVNPEMLSWHHSGAVLIMIILGGLGHLRGAVLGAMVFTGLQELFQSQAVFGAFSKHWQLMLGLTIIACVALMPRGLVGCLHKERSA